MCGIIGYIGTEQASPLILDGLRKLSYRGYDSSGLVVLDKTATMIRAVGKIEELEKKVGDIAGCCGIGHNRWATHGGVSEQNAHPHTDCHQRIFLVHNGIVENYQLLQKKLEEEGHVFESETDTEVLAHLIEKFFQGNLEQAVKQALPLVEGTYGLAVVSLDDPGKIVVARRGSPLVIASTKRGGVVASDPSALLVYSNRLIFLEDDEVAVLTADDCSIRGQHRETEISWTVEETQKQGYDHFMLKEIMEQPTAIESTLRGRLLADGVKLGGLELSEERLRGVKRVCLIACGTSYNAGLAGSYMIEERVGLPATAELASEFRYRKPAISNDTLFVFLSQSGETADTLAALREVKKQGGLTLGIVNAVGSSVARETDIGIYNHAGPEIGVASTKAFTSQVATLAMLTVFLGRQRGVDLDDIVQELKEMPRKIQTILDQRDQIKEVAEKYSQYKNFLYLGRRYGYSLALEGALKLKEISYIHAEGQPAGEMKHGTIALIEESFPSLVIAPKDNVYAKTLSTIAEIKSRNGLVITIGEEKIADDLIVVPRTIDVLTPILYAVPLQLFAYYIGTSKGYNVDQPRNLAKAVTVE